MYTPIYPFINPPPPPPPPQSPARHRGGRTYAALSPPPPHVTSPTQTDTPTMALQVAANLTTMFPERGPLISRYAAAKAAGFKVVEVSLPYSETTQRLAAELAKNGLRQIMINSDPGDMTEGRGFMGFLGFLRGV
ncbi:putative hydroxypyruvate isomerase [Portunus trituberculatus]|uniref:putative hydroxypyruvate isomerase n=1 Tax=Portunus trituberculatus TaxID=210409 RepID=UPI001E1CBCDE|nr:putative hydroxypyruvate isomerase [Portunus trituberculatus]